MPDDKTPTRDWKEIARELAGEKNPSKIIALSEELNRAIAEQNRNGVSLFSKNEPSSFSNSQS